MTLNRDSGSRGVSVAAAAERAISTGLCMLIVLMILWRNRRCDKKDSGLR
jgi:hypothetical protein